MGTKSDVAYVVSAADTGERGLNAPFKVGCQRTNLIYEWCYKLGIKHESVRIPIHVTKRQVFLQPVPYALIYCTTLNCTFQDLLMPM